MASEARLKLTVIAGAAMLAILAACAVWVGPSPRALTVCTLTLLPVLSVIWRSLGKLAPKQQHQLREKRIDVPNDSQALVNSLLALESQLEHAPVALFLVDQSNGNVEAINGNARRVIAPGRGSSPDALFNQLAAQPVGQRVLIGYDTEQGVERALVAVSSLTLRGMKQHLVALMPVESELEAEALNAWRQLVHVLMHEIMNSLTPVASLSHTAYALLNELRPNLPPESCIDFNTALDAISRRADSLINFVDSYRHLSNVPTPQPERVQLGDLFARLSALVAPGWIARGGRVAFTVDPVSLELMVDPGQFEQALINLLKNAADATLDRAVPEAIVSAKLTRSGRLRVEIWDNGPGVPDELIPQIFTPFFSTKEKGRGIGLAMVRQLTHANHGTVRYAKPVNCGACFIVTF